ncbi:MAG: PTS sugar transporter subunit IIA [Treponema sp.]|jgi:PTS system nitrogen regulatory IIA component|nr:PTS sugar transporter subunit IIA [Treponema sp.]
MENPELSLAALLRRGGLFYHAPGTRSVELLTWLVNMVTDRAGRGAVDREKLLTAVLEREELMPTAMGNGVALPHPRNPVIEKAGDQFAALAFPETPLDWEALDGKPVHAVILLVSASAKAHLSLLQRITFFCRDEGFCRLLDRQAPAEEILAYIEQTEGAWLPERIDPV